MATIPPEGWVAIPGAVIVREKHEKKSNTRDEIDERLETEEVHHLGHLTNQVINNTFFGLFKSVPYRQHPPASRSHLVLKYNGGYTRESSCVVK